MTTFEVVLRGYDRFAVDVLVQAIDAAAGDQEQIEAAIKECRPLPIVLRGYAPAQVDAWLEGCRTGDLSPGPHPQPSTAAFEFPIVLRGYRPAETDALFVTVVGALDSGDAARRREALRVITERRLPVGFRGFDRREVDRCLDRLADQLRHS